MTRSKKRVMREFKINEISAVDRPAQEHAEMTIMKRRDDGDEPVGFDTFEQAVDHLAKRHGCTRTDAMSMARREHPALAEKMNRRYAEQVADATRETTKRLVRPGAAAQFDLAVDEVMRRDGLPRSQAMRRARKEHPKKFAAYQEA